MSDAVMHAVDPDYFVALYLEHKADIVGEQTLMRELSDAADRLWNNNVELNVSFQEDVKGQLVSPEIVSSLKRLRQSRFVTISVLDLEVGFRFVRLLEGRQISILRAHRGSSRYQGEQSSRRGVRKDK